MKKLVLFLLIIGFAAGVANAAILKGPYLIYPGVNTEMMVLWQLSTTQTCTLQWGTSTAYSSGSVQTTEHGDHQHDYVITGLTPGQKYYYKVTESATHTGTFYAAPSASATNVKFVAFGDCRTNTATFDSIASRIISTYQADSGYQTFTMLSGDWVESGMTDSQWQEQFFNRSYANILQMQANLPINGVIGNHETLTTYGNDGNMFLKYWPYPYVNSGWNSSWTTGTHFWSFDYGPVHIANVDQYDGGYGSISQSQLNWLASDLANTSKTWKIIQLHQPGWSSDGQGAHLDTVQVQEKIQPLCLQYGVIMVIAGHNHYYTRCEVQEVVHITTGGAGPSLDTPDPTYTPYVVLTSKSYHIMKFNVDGTNEKIDVEAVNTGGSIIDSFSVDNTYSVMLPWSDGFESGNFTAGGWGISSASYCTITTDKYEGTYAARIVRANWIEKPISTYGMTDIHVKYARKTSGLDSGEFLTTEWSTDGATWNNLESTQDTSYAFVDKTCGAGANDNRAFRVRFRTNAGNSEYGFVDSVQITGTVSSDTTPPTPDPMTWATVPYATGESSIAMVASTASDSSGVEYYFDETSGNPGGSDSGWQSSSSYSDTGLSPSTQYTYKVQARDKSPNHNVTAFSTTASATTNAADTTPPTPNPMTWATVPYATGDSSIAMVATTASDTSGVEYFFDCITVGGHDSVWQDSTSYTDTGLSPGTQYTYQVKARDKSLAQNETTFSTTASATTNAADTTPPTPNPMTWATVPYATGSSSIAMVATTASDVSGVQYFFDCLTVGGHDSAWQDSTTYEDTGLASNTTYTYQVKARDKSSNYNETGFSTTASATTDTAGLLPFSDYFPVYGDFATGGWTTGGSSTNVNSQCMCEGINGAQMKQASWIEKAISTVGFTSITVTYYRKTSGMDSGEYLYSEWYDGTSWNNFESTQITTCGNVNQSAGTGANNNPNFKLRFRTNGSATNEYGCVDAVIIDGTPQ